jgi:hypothetical protein
MDCCIYVLYWNIDNPYIGQTVNFHTRKLRHYNEISKQTHCNYKILTEYEKYGFIMPEIDILQSCDENSLSTLEEEYINEFDSIKNGLNIISGGYSVGFGTNNSCSKYTEEQLYAVFKLLSDVSYSYKTIADTTKVALTTVKKIGQGAQHQWLHTKYPEIYEKIKLISGKERYSMSASAKAQNKKYRNIKSPEGVIYEVTNTLQFSKQHDLPNGNLCLVLKGERNSVKGWVGVD